FAGGAVVESVRESALDARDAVPDRKSNETRDIFDVQLEHNAAAVRVNARRRDAKASGNVLARAAVDDEFQNFSLTPAQALKQVVPGLSHLVDISEHVAWCFCRIPQQRRTPARPQDPAVPTAITSGARNLLLTK